MIEDDLTFYNRRLQEERVLVEQAASPEAASAHKLLAEIYFRHINELVDSGKAKALFGQAIPRDLEK